MTPESWRGGKCLDGRGLTPEGRSGWVIQNRANGDLLDWVRVYPWRVEEGVGTRVERGLTLWSPRRWGPSGAERSQSLFFRLFFPKKYQFFPKLLTIFFQFLFLFFSFKCSMKYPPPEVNHPPLKDYTSISQKLTTHPLAFSSQESAANPSHRPSIPTDPPNPTKPSQRLSSEPPGSTTKFSSFRSPGSNPI